MLMLRQESKTLTTNMASRHIQYGLTVRYLPNKFNFMMTCKGNA